MKRQVDLLIEKAADAENSEDALRLSQAACNAANAMYMIAQIEQIEASERPRE